MEHKKLIFWICLVVSTLVNIATIIWLVLIHIPGIECVKLAATMIALTSGCVTVVLYPEWSNNYTIKFVGFRPTFKPQKSPLPPDPYHYRHLGYGIVVFLMSIVWPLIVFLTQHHLRITILPIVGPLVLAILALIIVTEIRVRKAQ